MSKLIQMQRRIKAIETIQKITHAMRLVSMSSHSRLKNKQQTLVNYVTALKALFEKIQFLHPEWTNPIIQPPEKSTKTLLIVIASQKGLCGNFNTNLFNRFSTLTDLSIYQDNAIIAIGKKASEELKKNAAHALIDSYDQFTSSTFLDIAHHLTKHIVSQAIPYKRVIVWSNVAKSFFLQKPEQTILIPLQHITGTPTQTKSNLEEFSWELPASEILDTLAIQYLEARLEQLLFESLLAEQAARFISMDSSTRNAQNLLDETKLHYNKIRQAKITKELTELIGSF